MAITDGALISSGTRVRVRRANAPLDPAVIGRMGTVVDSTPYRARSYGVVLDGEREMRMFSPAELERGEQPSLPPDREEAKARRALP